MTFPRAVWGDKCEWKPDFKRNSIVVWRERKWIVYSLEMFHGKSIRTPYGSIMLYGFQSPLHTCSHSFLTATLWDRCYYYPYFTNEGTKTQRNDDMLMVTQILSTREEDLKTPSQRKSVAQTFLKCLSPYMFPPLCHKDNSIGHPVFISIFNHDCSSSGPIKTKLSICLLQDFYKRRFCSCLLDTPFSCLWNKSQIPWYLPLHSYVYFLPSQVISSSESGILPYDVISLTTPTKIKMFSKCLIDLSYWI